MNFKVLSLVFLSLFTASIICNVVMITLSTPTGWSYKTITHAVHSGYLTTNGTEPMMGDPIGGGGWP